MSLSAANTGHNSSVVLGEVRQEDPAAARAEAIILQDLWADRIKVPDWSQGAFDPFEPVGMN